MDIVLTLIAGIALGLGLGIVAAGMVLRSRAGTDTAQREAELERARSEAERARAEAAGATGRLQEQGTQVAEARRELAEQRAEAQTALARVAGLETQRDAYRERAEEVAADRASLAKDFEVLSAKVLQAQNRSAEESAAKRFEATEQLLAPVKESLAQVTAKLSEVEKERVRLQTELTEQVKTVQLTGTDLRRETQALVTALRKPQVRGSWGELQLKRVAELAGMLEHCDFSTQHTTTADDHRVRPDMRVDLSDGKCVFVDSKVPLTAFLEAHEAVDERDQTAALKRFAANVRSHVDQLGSKKYWSADGEASPEFTVLFMPSEALYAEAHAVLPDLHEYAVGKGIVLASPSTLIALLRTVAVSWQQANLARNAADVLALGRELHGRLVSMGEKFDKVGRGLTTAVRAYNDTVGSLEGRVMVSARRFRDLNVTTDELQQVGQVDHTVRALAEADLVENAAGVQPMIGRKPRSVTATVEDTLFESTPDAEELAAESASSPSVRSRDAG